jgi:transglutaminase-like putative cysteine protease
MYYSIRHVTRFRYSSPVSESVMEVRMQPRDDVNQDCQRFQLQTTPRTRIQYYLDHVGNVVHHFNVPSRHSTLTITAEALVQVLPPDPIPDALAPETWDALGELLGRDGVWDLAQPSHFAHPTEALRDLARDLNIERGSDPLSTLRMINTAINQAFEYAPQTTRVDSPIDEALSRRRGVCQDFAHVMIALVRELGIPCRYVSGYLFHRREDQDRSQADATHAWVEALLPELGWVGFDPTNNLLAGARHVRVAVGRDYDDVPPTRGVYKGGALGELEVSVRVAPSEAPPPLEPEPEPEPQQPRGEWPASGQNQAEQQQQ